MLVTQGDVVPHFLPFFKSLNQFEKPTRRADKIIIQQNKVNYYTLHIVLQYKINNIIWMIYGKCYDEGNNPMANPNIYNVYNL